MNFGGFDRINSFGSSSCIDWVNFNLMRMLFKDKCSFELLEHLGLNNAS